MQKVIIDPRHEEPPHGDGPSVGFDPYEPDRDANHAWLRLCLWLGGFGFSVIIGGAVMIAAWIASLVIAWPHSLYPPLCCNGTEMGGDCHPVACDSIGETKEGVYTWNGFKFSGEAMVHSSFDQSCHVCISKDQSGALTYPHCIFVQPSS